MNEARTRRVAFGPALTAPFLLFSVLKVTHFDGVFTQTNSGYQEKGQHVSPQNA